MASPLRIAFAIPDHPWVDAADAAAVNIAMTVGITGEISGTLCTVIAQEAGDGEGLSVTLNVQKGTINADLTIGTDVAGAVALQANKGISCPGVKLHGSGFIVTQEEAEKLGLGRVTALENHIRNYRNGRDLTDKPRGVFVIDLFGLAIEDVRNRFPEVYQWLSERVRPERDAKAQSKDGAAYAKLWWLFGKPRQELRKSLCGFSRYICTPVTAKHRLFQFLSATIIPDDALMCIASDDSYLLGILSSRIHTVWALRAGSDLGGNTPRYIKANCFEPFPFPVCDIVGAIPTGRPDSDCQHNAGEPLASPLHFKDHIRAIAESLDAHRKRQQTLHPDLGLTDMYNVLEKVREIEKCRGGALCPPASDVAPAKPGHPQGDAPTMTLTPKERIIHDKGLLSILRQLHEDLDAAVFAAYGWPITLTDEEILEKLVALNQERATEEKQGIIRWLRPEYQNPGGVVEPVQTEIDLALTEKPALQPLPKGHTAQLQAVKVILTATGSASADEIAKFFTRSKPAAITKLLEDLVALGLAKKLTAQIYGA